MKTSLGVGTYAHTCACVFNPLAKDIYQCNKLTLGEFTTVHLFGSSKSITFALTYGMFSC